MDKTIKIAVGIGGGLASFLFGGWLKTAAGLYKAFLL